MRVDQFDFELPEDRIALRPVSPRDSAKLLQVRPDGLSDHVIRDLPTLLRPGDTLVVNRTKVIPARLMGTRAPRDTASAGAGATIGGPRIEVTLHMRLGPNTWAAFAKPGKKLAEGDSITFKGGLAARVHEKREAGEIVLAFDQEGASLDTAIAEAGVMPLPPYIASRRAVDAQDEDDYQTLFARISGSVAAPTAGLHFTPNLMAALEAADIFVQEVCLHVGAGTFLPVKAEDTAEHKMHAEWGEVDELTAATLNRARERGGRIIPVGTTSLRILETATSDDGIVTPHAGETDIFITPGYRFKATDGLITNFHLPKSTLFMLVSALGGTENMKSAYRHAIDSGYRFYSYGDACLLWPEDAR